jgi:NADPH2 dehydrogenase
MTTRFPQVKRLDTIDKLRDRLAELGLDIPVDDVVDPAGPLAAPVTFTDASAGRFTAPNRFAVLPMEGWDGTTAGAPTDLVTRRWDRFARSGCGLVWGEATAVRADGRANPRQLVLGPSTADDIAALRARLDPAQVTGLQLTHSGRWSRPAGTPAPRTAYAHPLLDARVGAGANSAFTDDELDALVVAYADAAVLAAEAGFDFVDVKHCHGYLLHELLSGHDRTGRYGGDLAGRTRFLRTVVAAIRARAPRLAIAVRLSAFDLVPYVAGDDGRGERESDEPYAYAFGGDGTGVGIDLREAHAFCDLLVELGIGLVSITAGSPYYNPHVQRPAYFPPSDGYRPPEDPLVGVARHLAATAELTHAHPELTVIGSAYSYLQDWLPNVAQAVVARGDATMIGLGRMMLSYPTLAADVLAARSLDARSICRTFSDCTTAPRAGLVSGCFPIDPFYKDHPDRVELTRVKRTVARCSSRSVRSPARSCASCCWAARWGCSSSSSCSSRPSRAH